jgi:putative ABC transport system permease protein
MPADTPRTLTRALLSLAWRENRATRRRLLLYMSSITLGVASLVAIDSFGASYERSMLARARELWRADVRFFLIGPGEFPTRFTTLLDSLDRNGAPVAKATELTTMVIAPHGTGGARLIEMRAVSDRYPLYGEIATEPPGRWPALQSGARAIVDPSVLTSLGVTIGDTLSIGAARFEIAATIVAVAGDLGMQAPIFPRVYVPLRLVAATGLAAAGSQTAREAMVRLPNGTHPSRFVDDLRPRLDSLGVEAMSVDQYESYLGDAIGRLHDFIGVVGLVALLLGGLGVASGVRAFVLRKLSTVATLRCLGATNAQVIAIYALQAGMLGFVGAAAGASLGVALQFAAPSLLHHFLRIEPDLRIEPFPIVTGLTLGVTVALAFALRPLLALRDVSPIRALRSEQDGLRSVLTLRQWPKRVVDAVLVASVVLMAASRSSSALEVVALSGALLTTIGLFWATAWAITRTVRRGIRARWPFVIRQGLANLYRPANQTRPVILALGFCAFLLSSLALVQENLVAQFTQTSASSKGNLLLYDVQDDQAYGVDSIVGESGATIAERIPIVTMRVAQVNGQPVSKILEDTTRKHDRWALLHEHRATYRDSLGAGERVVEGAEFSPRAATPAAVAEVSIERWIAEALRVEVGHMITWDVQGRPLVARVTSIREPSAALLSPDFAIIFPSGLIDGAPKMWARLAVVNDAPTAERIQRRVLERFPNVSSIDLTLIQRTIEEMTAQFAGALRFLALFSVAMGLPVLLSAVAATRHDRVREGVLLKVLGATRSQVRRILVSEYALLGILGSLAGMVLSFAGAWAVLRFMFDRPFAPIALPAMAIASTLMLVTVSVGLLGGRDVFRQTAMSALREGG